MKRREALSSVGLILGGTIIGSNAFLTGCTNLGTENIGLPLSQKHLDLLNEVGETILPKSAKTPGAKEVNVGSFMNAIVKDFYTQDEQNIFLDGLVQLNNLTEAKFKDDFVNLSSDQRSETLMALESEAGKALEGEAGTHFYIMMKQLTIWGYLSSEAVAFEAFNHMVLTPDFESCTPYEKGDKAIFNDAGQGQAYSYATHHMKKEA